MIMTAMFMMKTEMHDLSKNKAAKVSLPVRKRMKNKTNMNKFLYVACELNLRRMKFNTNKQTHSYVLRTHSREQTANSGI